MLNLTSRNRLQLKQPYKDLAMHNTSTRGIDLSGSRVALAGFARLLQDNGLGVRANRLGFRVWGSGAQNLDFRLSGLGFIKALDFELAS